jgi:hypothetical protein
MPSKSPCVPNSAPDGLVRPFGAVYSAHFDGKVTLTNSRSQKMSGTGCETIDQKQVRSVYTLYPHPFGVLDGGVPVPPPGVGMPKTVASCTRRLPHHRKSIDQTSRIDVAVKLLWAKPIPKENSRRNNRGKRTDWSSSLQCEGDSQECPRCVVSGIQLEMVQFRHDQDNHMLNCTLWSSG